MRTTRLLATGLIALAVAACSSAGASPSSAPSEAASVAPSDGASVAPSASADACATDSLAVVTAGTFTIGTDNPAYPPYFAENASGTATAPWELGDPTTGEGFESALGFAIADRLGFTKDQVAWVVVPFANAFAPGEKTFDIDLNQVTFTEERTQTADLTEGYYFGNQSLVALKDSPVAKATSIAELKDFVFGAQVGTTSYDAINEIIAPTKAAAVYDTNDAAIEALSAGTIDGDRRGPADRGLHHERPGRERHDRRPVRGRDARALQRRPDQGQPADRLRRCRHRVADRRRHAGRTGQQVAAVPGHRPGPQAVIEAGSGGAGSP